MKRSVYIGTILLYSLAVWRRVSNRIFDRHLQNNGDQHRVDYVLGPDVDSNHRDSFFGRTTVNRFLGRTDDDFCRHHDCGVGQASRSAGRRASVAAETAATVAATSTFWGNLIMLFCAIAWSVSTVVSKSTIKLHHACEARLLGCVFIAAFSFPLGRVATDG